MTAVEFAAVVRHRPSASVLIRDGLYGTCAIPLHDPGHNFNDTAMDSGIACWIASARE